MNLSQSLFCRTGALLCCALFSFSAHAQGSNMIGRQSQNEGIEVLPAARAVAVDGDLSDWDFSGRIWAFADKGVRDRYSAEVAGMWDSQNLYLAVKWHDPTPMQSTIDPRFNPQFGWKSDALQLRIRTDQTLALTAWYYTPEKRPVLQIGRWKNNDRERDGYDFTLLQAAPGATELGSGASMAYRAAEDGKGYVQEMRLPWKLLYNNPPHPAAGQKLQIGMEFLWGDAAGASTTHRYADNMQPGETSREFFWSNYKAWGDAKLSARQHIELKQYVADSERLRGVIPIRVEIPASAARFTIAIDDASGKRIRNLAGDFDARDYGVAVNGERRTVEVRWDGKADDGTPVSPGKYFVHGLSHDGLTPVFDTAYYNPGTPPWSNAAGSGAWGGDHSAPTLVARSGDWMIVGWGNAEGGSGIIGVGPDGRKQWGEKSGAQALCADDKYVYAIARGFGIRDDLPLVRLGKTDGSYQPFVRDGKARPFLLRLSEIVGQTAPPAGGTSPQAVALAVGGGNLALALADDRLAILDAASGVLKKIIPAPKPVALAFAPDGALYGAFDGKLARVQIETGKIEDIPVRGMERIGALACDSGGNIAVYDSGSDSQIKIFSPAGKLLGTRGRKGGRAWSGVFDPQGMMRVSSIAADAQNNFWATERWDYPRRVSVWQPDGTLARDYIGNTEYSGTGSFLDAQDPDRGYVRAVEMKLDRATGANTVERILWNPDSAKNQAFALQPVPGVGNWFPNPTFLSSAASGEPRRYLLYHGGHMQHAIYMERGKIWQPVSAIATVDEMLRQLPQLKLEGHELTELVFWHDANNDAAVSTDELSFASLEDVQPAAKVAPPAGRRNARPVRKPAPTGGGWGTRFGTDFSLVIDGGFRFRPLRFTAEGVPVYGPESLQPPQVDANGNALRTKGDRVPLSEDHLLLSLAAPSVTGLDTRSGEILWTYPNPYHGVHGSHEATMPQRGLLIGPLKIAGVVNLSAEAGKVFLIRGNLGQDYILTTDGLYVGSLFEDTRLPGEALPATLAELRGQSLDGYSEGGEPFSGWFGKQEDGKVRLTTSLIGQAATVVEVRGLDSIRKFTGPALEVDAATLARAASEAAATTTPEAVAKTYAIHRVDKAPAIDGNNGEWNTLPALPMERVGQPTRGTLKLAYDDHNLYALFEVTDASPMKNEGKDFTRLFKTGDAVDLQLGAGQPLNRKDPMAGDARIVISQWNGKPVAVLMQPVDAGAPAGLKHLYSSPVGNRPFDRVQVLETAHVALRTGENGYTLEASIPLDVLGLHPQPGQTLRGDAGIIASDAAGMTNVARIYWANPDTNLVNDLPSEAWFNPSLWGEFNWEGAAAPAK